MTGMFEVRLPDKMTRQRYIVVLVAARRMGGRYGAHTMRNRGQEISQVNIDNVANAMAREVPTAGHSFIFPDDSEGALFRLKYM